MTENERELLIRTAQALAAIAYQLSLGAPAGRFHLLFDQIQCELKPLVEHLLP